MKWYHFLVLGIILFGWVKLAIWINKNELKHNQRPDKDD